MFLQKTCFDKIQCQSMWESLGVTYRLGAPIWLDCQTVTDVPTSPLGPTGAFDITIRQLSVKIKQISYILFHNQHSYLQQLIIVHDYKQKIHDHAPLKISFCIFEVSPDETKIGPSQSKKKIIFLKIKHQICCFASYMNKQCLIIMIMYPFFFYLQMTKQ